MDAALRLSIFWPHAGHSSGISSCGNVTRISLRMARFTTQSRREYGGKDNERANPRFDLQFMLCDAMRGVKLATLRRTLTEDERQILARAIFDRLKLSHCEVICHPSRGGAHSSIGKSQGE